MKLLVKISWLYMPVCTDRTGALLQIGSSSRDSVPVPFHLLPGKCSLTPDECLLFMQQTTLYFGYQRNNLRVVLWEHEKSL